MTPETHALASAFAASLIGDQPAYVAALDRLASDLAPRVAAHLGLEQSAGPPVYTVATVALELGVTEKTVRGWISRGELRATKRGARWLIERSAVEELGSPEERRELHRSARPRRVSRRQPNRRPLGSVLAGLDDGE